MKTILTSIALVVSLTLIGQIPSGYYNDANGTGFVLKTQLHNIIKDHTDNGYGGLWITYATSDLDKEYDKDNSIIDIYSENPSSKDPYKYTLKTSQCGVFRKEGECYNREHIIPQSTFDSASPMVSDAHFIPPTDGWVNSLRSNNPHGIVAEVKNTSMNGGKLGTSAVPGYTGTVFEPLDEFKGDIARMYFYFATRYENTVSRYSYPMFDKSRNKVFTTAFLNMLLSWHQNDPVSSREITRNNAIYKRQGNRNPFIDNPLFVNKIWGGKTIDNVNTTATDLMFTEYIEGSSNNKALEVTNRTLKSINLSNYTIKKQTNGSGSWSSGITLSGNLASKSNFIIINSNMLSSCIPESKANLSTLQQEMNFNGNDPIGLFKNNILIDIIGNFNGGSSNFAFNTTLRRKTSVTKPSTKFDKTAQWDAFPIDSCLGDNRLGFNDNDDNFDFNLFPNPANSYFIIELKGEEFEIEIFSLLGSKIYTKKVYETTTISNLETGIYFVKMNTKNNSLTKKLIIN
jgi:endonuclease I